jgi:hypothetical protein
VSRSSRFYVLIVVPHRLYINEEKFDVQVEKMLKILLIMMLQEALLRGSRFRWLYLQPPVRTQEKMVVVG